MFFSFAEPPSESSSNLPSRVVLFIPFLFFSLPLPGRFASPTCSQTEGFHTFVYARPQLCQTAPAAVGAPGNNLGYTINCNPDGSGFIGFHTSAPDCPGEGAVNQPFQRNQCVQQPPGWGSNAFTVDCTPANIPVQPTPAQIPEGDFAAVWFEDGTCTSPQDFTVVVGPQDICHVVPQKQTVAGQAGGGLPNADLGPPLPTVGINPLAGYSVQCFDDESGGIIRFSNQGDCGNIQAQTTFKQGQCLPNPSIYGSSSVKFFCRTRSQQQNQAQGTTHARIDWFEDAACVTGTPSQHRTVVIARQGFCQRVPDRNAGYVSFSCCSCRLLSSFGTPLSFLLLSTHLLPSFLRSFC